MSFEQLLGRIKQAATLAKSQPAAESKDGDGDGAGGGLGTAAAAGDGAEDGEDGEGNGDESGGKSGDKPTGEQDAPASQDGPLAKSFRLTLDDGTEMEAFDGAELIKSLNDRVQAAESAQKQNEAQVLKSLNAAVDLISAQSAQLTEQRDLIKSLQTKVEALGKTGRGRVSVLTVADKPQLTTLAKSQPAAMGGEELIAKALGAMKAGRITGLEASGIENRVRMGIAVDPELVARVCG
ncbi:MAG TPA: hypothetical protein VF472_07310 [Burkholderiaceae bacterium]